MRGRVQHRAGADAAYDGPLYQIRRSSDGATTNVGLLSAGGYGNATEQDVFCAHTNCVITELYDQSGKGNNLTIEERAARPGGRRRQRRRTAGHGRRVQGVRPLYQRADRLPG